MYAAGTEGTEDYTRSLWLEPSPLSPLPPSGSSLLPSEEAEGAHPFTVFNCYHSALGFAASELDTRARRVNGSLPPSGTPQVMVNFFFFFLKAFWM